MKVTFTNIEVFFLIFRYVKLVKLPTNVQVPAEGTDCVVTGWGIVNSRTNATPAVLQQANIRMVGEQKCRLANFKGIDKTMICAGLPEGGTDFCRGDSGGPLVCKGPVSDYFLQGVVSTYADDCALQGDYSIYAKVKYFLAWIDKQMFASG